MSQLTDRPATPRGRATAEHDGLRIAGIPIQIDWTVGLLFVVIAYTTGTGLLPAAVPGAPAASHLTAGVLGAALFLAGLLVHELAHALVARRAGVNVAGVGFWLFGGPSGGSAHPRSPGIQAKIAAAGPAASLLLAVAFATLWYALAVVQADVAALASVTAGYLAAANLVLAVVNLIPGTPLDGGRLLHAVVWARTGDRLRATRAAARGGQSVGVLLGAAGVTQLLWAGSFAGVWTMLIGLFIAAAARADAGNAVVTSALAGLRVRDIVPNLVADGAPEAGSAQPPTDGAVPGWHNSADFLDRYQRSADVRTAVALVAFDGSPAGVLTLPHLATIPADQRATTRLTAVATPADQVATTRPDELVTELLPRLRRPVGSPAARHTIGHAVITNAAGHPIGVLTPHHLNRAVRLAGLTHRDAQRPAEEGPARPVEPTVRTPAGAAR